MRYRKQTESGDYTFGSGFSTFHVNTPEAVAQAVLTRMRLYAQEWFLDKREGLDRNRILGYGTQTTRDREVQQRILGTEGVLNLLSYGSSVDGRDFRVTCSLDTIYGPTTIDEVL